MMDKIKTKTIKQEVIFKASPHEIFEMLMDSKKHSKFTGAKAKISRKVGGKISAYGDYIEGKNIEIIPDKKIVQKWRGNEWPLWHFSIAKFEMKKSKNGTKLIFTQTGVPAEHSSDISKGWKEHYWTKMKKMLEK